MEDIRNLVIILFINVTMIGLGYVVFSKGKSSITNQSFFLFTISFIVWLSFNFLSTWLSNDNLAIISTRLDLSTAPMAAFFLTFFLINYPDSSKKLNGWRFLILFLPMLATSILTAFGFVAKNISITQGEIRFEEGPLYLFYASIISIYLSVGFLRLYLRFRISEGVEKKHLKIVIIGFGITIFILLLFNLMLQNFIPTKIYQLSSFSPLILVIFTGYAIIRHQLFNIKLFSVQILTLCIWILTLLHFFYVQSFGGYVFSAIIFIFSIVFGLLLINSVKKEIIQKQELQIANEKLKQLDEAKSEFISIASHQLRTPLTMIRGFISMIKTGVYGKIPSSLTEPLDQLNSANDRLVDLVEDLLNISRIESGRMTFDFQKGDICIVLKDLHGSFLPLAEEKGLNLKIAVPKNLPKINFDHGKIRETISNLIDNSIKYTRKGSVKIAAEKSGGNVKITVSDSGIGIPEGEMNLLFNKFSRGKEARTIRKDGSGLGLYLGKKVIEAHGGKIWAESGGEGKGSKFILELPIV